MAERLLQEMSLTRAFRDEVLATARFRATRQEARDLGDILNMACWPAAYCVNIEELPEPTPDES